MSYFPWSFNFRGFEFCKISLHLKYVEPFEQGCDHLNALKQRIQDENRFLQKHFPWFFRPYHSLVYIFLLPCFDDCGQAVDLLTFCVECPSKHLGQISYQRISPKCKQSKEMSMSTVSKSRNICSFGSINLTKRNQSLCFRLAKCFNGIYRVARTVARRPLWQLMIVLIHLFTPYDHCQLPGSTTSVLKTDFPSPTA